MGVHVNSRFDWLPVARLSPVTGYSKGADCPARCGPAESDRLLSLGDALRQSLQRGGQPRFDCLTALHTALVCDTSPAIYALQPDARAIPDDFHRFGWLTPAQAHRLHTEEVTAAVASVQADRADSGITADEISFRDFRALVCDPGKPALVRRLAVILNGVKGGGNPDPLGLFRRLDDAALYELWDECRHTSRPPFTWANFDTRSDRSADDLLNDADSVDLTFLDCVAIKLTDADRLLGHLLPTAEAGRVMPILRFQGNGMKKAETPKGAFTWTGRQDGFAMSAYPLGEDRLIFLEEIVRQIEAARPLPSHAIRAEIIKALEGAPIPAYRMGQSLGAESLEDHGYGYVTAARAEELKSEYLAALKSWRRKGQEAHEKSFDGWRRHAAEHVPPKPVEIDYDQFICPPGFPSLIRRLKLEWLREGHSGLDGRWLIKFVAIKLTDANRLLGHLLPAPAPEQVMPAAPESQPVQGQQEGNHRHSLAQQYGLQPIKCRDEEWTPEMQIALADAFDELTKRKNVSAALAWEIVGDLCGGVSRPAMRKHRHKGVELKNERNRLLKSA